MTDTFDNSEAGPAGAIAALDPAASAPTDTPNYFDRYNAEADAGEPGLLERARLNAKHSYYRGTLAGASDLMGMAHVYQMDDTGATPDQKEFRKSIREKYDGVVNDLARYDLIKPWGTTTEGAAALAGQLAGGAASPESLLGWGSSGANLAIRTAKAAVQQGVITGTVDPIVQYLNIGGGVQKEYDPIQTGVAFGTGAIIGGGLHIGGELISSAHIKQTMADLGKDDPQFRSAGDVADELSKEAAPGSTTTVDINGTSETRTGGVAEAALLPGQPDVKVAYHGTQDVIEKFDPSKTRLNRGVFFADDPNLASKFAEGRAVDSDPARIYGDDTNQEITRWVEEHAGASEAKRITALMEEADGLEHGTDRQEALYTKINDELKKLTGLDQSYGDSSPNVTMARISLGKNHEIDMGGKFNWEKEREAIDHALEHGYDSVTFTNTGEAGNYHSILNRDNIHPYHEPPTPRTEEQQALITHRSDTEAAIASEDAAIAKRTKGGGNLPMEQKRPAGGAASTGGTGGTGNTGTAIATVPTSPAQDVAIKSLQQQSFSFADAIGFPLRQGRIAVKNALGVFNTKSGVVRVREVPDFEVVAHEAGHYIEAKVGKELTNLTNQFATELAPMVSNAAAYDPAVHVKEGFAEFIRRYIGNPAHAQQVAPGFTIAFRNFMDRKAPDILKAIDEAGASYRAYLDAPSVDAVAAVVRSRSEEAKGWKKVLKSIQDDGFATTVKSVVQGVYRGLLDDKAPIARAVRELGAAIKEQTNGLVDLKAADNPEVLARLFERSHQAAVRDMMDGVRGYHSVTPQGPSISDALAHATGSPTVWGKWDPEKKALFSDFIVARRVALLWDKFKAGELANPPASFSKADAVVAMAELEKANPRFREASDMLHKWTLEMLRKQRDGGLLSPDLFDKLSKEEFYAPLMRDLSDKPLAGKGGASSDGPGMTQTVRRMKGSARDIKDPIESLMTQAFLVNRTLAHNDIIKSFVSLAERAGIEGGRYVEKVSATEARGYSFDMMQAIERLAKERGVNADDTTVLTSALTDLFGEDPIVGSFFRKEPANKRGEPLVFYKEAGQLKAARFMADKEGHALYETLTGLPKPLTDVWSQMVAATTTTLRSGITTNPMFALTNYIRDQFAVSILRSDYLPIISGLRGLKQEVTQGESAVLYGYAGGISGGASIAPVHQAIEADVNALAKKGYLVNRLTSFRGLMELAAVTESGTRNSVFGKVFEAKKAQGLSDWEAMIEAAHSAQDILDFSRHGSHTDMIRKYVPFINAWGQGLDKARRTMFEPIIDKLRDNQVFASDPVAFNNAMQAVTKLFGVGGVLGAGWAALNAEKEAYRDASPLLKGTHVVVPMGNKVALVPKPFELGIGFTAGEYAYQALVQQDPRAASQFATAAWDSMTSGNPITDIPILKQYFELKSGKSLFTGRDIVPSNLQRRAVEEQYFNNTSSMAKAIGRQIGVSPIKVDYAVGSTFGLWGKDVMALSSGVDPDAPAQSWEDTVFIRRLLKDPSRTSDVTTKFWDYMGKDTGKFNQAVTTYDDMIKDFADDDAKAFAARLPDAQRAYVVLRSAANESGKPAFSADEKRLHPLQRAYDAVSILNEVKRELTSNTFNTYETGERKPLSPQGRRDLIDNVRELAQMEMRNALVILKEPGYANRAILNVNDTMDKIMDADAVVGNEIATRYASAKIYKTDAVAKVFPSLQSALLREGSEADLAPLAFDVSGDGYQFDGDRVRKPLKRRLPVH